ncbi:MAG: helicase-associated domain-containing protein [Chloroflexia bacterium]
MRTLRQALEGIPTALLREMARFWKVPEAEQAGRPRLIAGLLERMGRAESVRDALGRLEETEREVLYTLLEAGGRVRAAVLTHRYGPLRPPGLAPSHPEALNPTERLHRRGFLFRTLAAWEDYAGPTFFIPPELLALLPAAPRPRPDELLRVLPPEEVRSTPADLRLHRDLACLLAFFRREDYGPPEEDVWPKDVGATLQRVLSPATESTDASRNVPTVYAAFGFHLARQAQLLAPDQEGWLRPTAEGLEWLRLPPIARAQVLFQAWCSLTAWDEIFAIPELERLGPADPSIPRGRVLKALASLEAGRWYTLAGWLRFIESSAPDFLQPEGTSGRLRLRSGRPLPTGPAAWKEVEGRYLRFIVEGPLHWLGLVDLGKGAAGDDAFRLNDLGQSLLHPEAGRPHLEEEPAAVEGTFEVWVPLEASPYIVFILEEYAERVCRDALSLYRLTRPALHRALERGAGVERLIEALERCGRGALPQNVAYTLREWASAYGKLRLRRPLLLTAAEAERLSEVLADPTIRAACGDRLSPTAVEVPAEQVAALLEALGRLGYLPQVEEGLLPRGERFPLALDSRQRIELLALLWTWEEERGGLPRSLAGLTQALARTLSPAELARARRRKERRRGDL